MSMVKEYSTEIKVGVLVFAALLLAGVFLWLLGDYTPIGRTYNIYVTYNFAGGVELGTPVRVSGIKVGKVTKIQFLPPSKKAKNNGEAALKIKLNISRTVEERVRFDSEFFVNQAGIIGERYIEIMPGTASSKIIPPGTTVIGIDPPRIDQMISQSYDVFEQISTIIEENKEGLIAAIQAASELGKIAQKLVDKLDGEDVETLRRILKRVDRITARLDEVMGDVGPTLAQVRRLLRDAGPMLEHADQLIGDIGPVINSANKLLNDMNPVINRAGKLLKDVDDLAEKLRNLPEDKREEITRILERMTDTATELQNVVARMDAFTAYVETQYPDLDRAKIEELLRRFLQEEGVKINVGEVKFRSRIAPLPDE